MNRQALPDEVAPLGQEIFFFDELSSSLDKAYELARENRLGIWDSVLAASQTAGRGQLRRRWHSPPGNIYAALRLPVLAPFDQGAAAPAMGLLLAESLNELGWPVRLKWPNDLALESDSGPRKVAGILLEERAGILLAGIGVNVASHPGRDALRPHAALAAASLASSGGDAPLPPVELWPRLVNRMVSAYGNAHIFVSSWRERAEALLLWKGDMVMVEDGQTVQKGRLAGLWSSGGLRLETESGALECTSGSLLQA